MENNVGYYIGLLMFVIVGFIIAHIARKEPNNEVK